MAELLPKILVVAGGLCLSFLLLAFWQSLRGVIAQAGQETHRASGVSAARAALLGEAGLAGELGDFRLELGLGRAIRRRVVFVEQRDGFAVRVCSRGRMSTVTRWVRPSR